MTIAAEMLCANTKLVKAEGLILVKIARLSIKDSMGCCAFQMSLVYNRVCWDSFSATAGFSVLKNVLGGPRDFPGIFFGVPGGRPAGFCVVLGSRKLGEGRLG